MQNTPPVTQTTPAVIDQTKVNVQLLWNYEQRWIAWAVPRLPQWLNGTNLTLASIFWIVCVIAAGIIGQGNAPWLWAINAFLLLQYLTDSLDGAVGRYRRSGLLRWGHYMDHLLDFIFMGAILISYALILPGYRLWFMVLLALLGSLQASTHLMHSVTNTFPMSYFRIGLTEVRIVVIALNIAIILFGHQLLPYALILSSIALSLALVYGMYVFQKKLRYLDRQPPTPTGERRQTPIH